MPNTVTMVDKWANRPSLRRYCADYSVCVCKYWQQICWHIIPRHTLTHLLLSFIDSVVLVGVQHRPLNCTLVCSIECLKIAMFTSCWILWRNHFLCEHNFLFELFRKWSLSKIDCYRCVQNQFELHIEIPNLSSIKLKRRF